MDLLENKYSFFNTDNFWLNRANKCTQCFDLKSPKLSSTPLILNSRYFNKVIPIIMFQLNKNMKVEIREARQAQNVQEESFVKLTNTYKLSAKLTSGSLNITLEDYVSWIKYEREYTEADIGKQIHKKAQLPDLYSALSQSSNSDESKMMEMEMDKQKIGKIQYKFGDVVHLLGVPCYKVEQGGKLTIYLNVLDRLTKKQVSYESILLLNKIKQFSQIEVQYKKVVYQKNQQQANKKILLELLQKQDKELTIIPELKKTLQDKENQFKATENAMIKKENELNQKITLMQEELKQKNEKLKYYQRLIQKQNQNKQIGKLSAEQIQLSLENKFNYNHKQFRTCKTVIEYIGSDRTYTQFLILSVIPYKMIYRFKVRIIRSSSCQICIGVADYRQQPKRTNVGTSNAVYYHGRKGQVIFKQEKNNFFGNKPVFGISTTFKQAFEAQASGSSLLASGFQEGDTVQTQVHLQSGKIKWSVEGKMIGSLQLSRLKETSNFFIPAIEFYRTNDIVELVKQSL